MLAELHLPAGELPEPGERARLRPPLQEDGPAGGEEGDGDRAGGVHGDASPQRPDKRVPAVDQVQKNQRTQSRTMTTAATTPETRNAVSSWSTVIPPGA